MNSITERGSENKDRAKTVRTQRRNLLGAALMLALATAGSAQPYMVLKNFTGSDGANPGADLVLAGNTLYGTTPSGGSSNYGVVFKVNTDGSGYTALKNFTGSDGANPRGKLVLENNTLYGTTYSGGSSNYGVVFEVSTNGSGYTALKNFTGSDGANPAGGLLLDNNTLYGTTYSGGSSNYGVVFKINTDGSEYTVLKSFTGMPDGEYPRAGLVLAGNTLYGTTSRGGSYQQSWEGYGTVFEVNTDGSGYTVLKSFGPDDGVVPLAGLVLADNTLYGTAFSGLGDGVVFKVNTDGSDYTVLQTGGEPLAGLVLAGNTLYGTTYHGGSFMGTVFNINTNGSDYTVLKSFTGGDGANPAAGLALGDTTLYGTTQSGGSSNYGVVFSLTCLSITTPPVTQTAETGATVRLSVEAVSPASTLAYQWFFGETNALPGATNALLELSSVQPAQAGAYTVEVTNLWFSVTSAPALLGVIPPINRTVVPAVSLTGGAGSFLHLEYADNLATPQWFSLSDVTLGDGPQFCFDLSQPLPAQRFYRAWQTNGPQPALNASMATEIPLAGAIGSSVRVDYINQFGPIDAWVTLDTVLLTNTPQLYFDVTAFRQPTRLYRLVPLP